MAKLLLGLKHKTKKGAKTTGISRKQWDIQHNKQPFAVNNVLAHKGLNSGSNGSIATRTKWRYIKNNRRSKQCQNHKIKAEQIRLALKKTQNIVKETRHS